MKISSVKPVRDYISVTIDDVEEKSPGGIFVPKTVEQGVVTGTVVGVGSGKVMLDGKVVKLEVRLKEKICFWKQGATEIKTDEGSVYLLREDQVLCKLV
jgi:chaperonin GroES